MDNGGTLHAQAFVRMEISKTRKREWLHSMFYSNVKRESCGHLLFEVEYPFPPSTSTAGSEQRYKGNEPERLSSDS